MEQLNEAKKLTKRVKRMRMTTKHVSSNKTTFEWNEND